MKKDSLEIKLEFVEPMPHIKGKILPISIHSSIGRIPYGHEDYVEAYGCYDNDLDILKTLSKMLYNDRFLAIVEEHKSMIISIDPKIQTNRVPITQFFKAYSTATETTVQYQ